MRPTTAMSLESGCQPFTNRWPNHALQRTPGFGVQLPSAALIRPAQSRAVLPAMKPGTARAFASRRPAPAPVPKPAVAELGVVRRRRITPHHDTAEFQSERHARAGASRQFERLDLRRGLARVFGDEQHGGQFGSAAVRESRARTNA